MAGEHERNRNTARGLAKAAMNLAAKDSASATALIDEALELYPDSLVLAANCRLSVQQFDATRLETATIMARARADDYPELQVLVRQLEAGPLRAIDLARQLADRQPLQLEPVPGRIAYILHSSLPHSSNGYAMRSQGMAQALLDRGIDLACLTKPGFPFDLNRQQHSLDSLASVETVDGVDYRRIKAPLQRDIQRLPSDITAHAPIQYLERAIEALVQEFRDVRPSCVVTASNFVSALPAAIAARRLGLPFIYEVRGFWEITRESRDPGYLQTPVGKQEVFLETAVVRAADAVLTLTRPMRRKLIERGVPAERITLAPNACHVENFLPSPRSETLLARLQLDARMPVIGYAGSFTQYEGLDDLVQACGYLKAQGMEFRLLLVGSEPADEHGAFPVTDRIREIARRNGMEDWLIMPGRVPHDEVAQWYSLIDIAPFPRKSLPVTELVSPLKPLEALAMEKAIVVSSVGGMRDMVRDEETGLVFAKGDIGALSDALRRLLEDADLRRKLGRAGRAWVSEERSWSKAAEALLGVVANVAAGERK